MIKGCTRPPSQQKNHTEAVVPIMGGMRKECYGVPSLAREIYFFRQLESTTEWTVSPLLAHMIVSLSLSTLCVWQRNRHNECAGPAL